MLKSPRIAQRGWETRKQSHIVWEQDRFRLGKPKIPEKESDVERKEKKCAESETMCRKKAMTQPSERRSEPFRKRVSGSA